MEPHDGSTSDPHMPECRFHVEPTFVYFILSLQLVNILVNFVYIYIVFIFCILL